MSFSSSIRRLRFSFAILLPLGLGSCASLNLTRACRENFPRFEAQVAQATVAVSRSGRAIASLSQDGDSETALSLPLSDREAWLEWTVDRLKESQTYLDLTDGDQRLLGVRQELIETANDLVALHSFVQSRKYGRMEKTLAAIRARAHRIRGLACQSSL